MSADAGLPLDDAWKDLRDLLAAKPRWWLTNTHVQAIQMKLLTIIALELLAQRLGRDA